MQTPVRYYITQSDDQEQPIVRTIPVATHPVPRVIASPAPAAEQSDGERAVAKLMRRAVRRPGAPK